MIEPTEQRTSAEEAHAEPEQPTTGVEAHAEPEQPTTGVEAHAEPEQPTTGVEAHAEPEQPTTGVEAHAERESKPSRAVLAGLLGVGVAFLCFVPPILHFITGPLAPGIGGFVAGTRTGAAGDDVWIIGGTIGVGFAVILGIGALVISAFVGGGRPLPGLSAIVSGVGLIYGTLLGALGASLAGRMERS